MKSSHSLHKIVELFSVGETNWSAERTIPESGVLDLYSAYSLYNMENKGLISFKNRNLFLTMM